MGSTTSKPAPAGEKQLILESPNVDPIPLTTELVGQAEPTSQNGTLTQRNIEKWDAKTSKDPKLNLARTILVHNDISSALLKREAVIKDQHVFNNEVGYKTSPTTNQKASGRCWLFATTNVLRYTFAQKLNIKEFELSQSYLFFWDKLNKANYFLEQAILLADQPADSRLWAHLTSVPLNDGGQWDMAINLFGTYGVVPQAIFPESFSSSSSGRLNALLTTKVREHSIILRRLNASMRASPELATLSPEVRDAAILKVLRAKKEEFMAEVWTVMTISLGTPPKPDTKFTYEYVDADGKFHSWSGTPVQFYQQFSHQKFPPTESFSLINDPRNAYDKRYTVEYLGNVWGGKPVRYVNTTSQRLKDAVIASIKNGQPVFFGCDVGQSSERAYGIMDTDLYDYENAFGIKLGLSKAERLQVGESLMTHAMVISAVHLDSAGKPVRYKVENSWGETSGVNGYFVMTDKWFDEFVYQVVIPRALAPKDLVEVLDGADETVLPAWDPMGNLA